MNGSELSLYFLHPETSGKPQLDYAQASAMAVFNSPLRNFLFSSAYCISVMLAMAANSQVCSEVDCHPGSAGSWLIKFGLACFSTWQVGRATGNSGFLYNFDIRWLLATFISFHVTIYYYPSSYYSPSAAKSFYSHFRLFFFHCTGSSILNFSPSKFSSLLNDYLFL